MKKENKKFQENAQEQQQKSEATLYHFLDVHQKMVADKAISEDQAAQLRKVINDLKVEKEEIKKLSSIANTQLEMALSKSIKKLEENIGNFIAQEAIKETVKCTDHLNNAVANAGNTLENLRRKSSTEWWKSMLSTATISIICAAGVGYTIIKYSPPQDVYPVTDSVSKHIAVGSTLEEMWPKLSKQEKQQLKEKAGKGSALYYLDNQP